jgi:tRNA-guanine family transglycosylase
MKYVPKHYLLSDPVFWDPIFLRWDYTESILLTAYDLLRNDKMIYILHSKSLTLKELMREQGFPKDTKILADTGIFMLEWFKLVKGKTFNQDYSKITLPIKEVLEAYELMDPDLMIAPDEIILPKDSDKLVKQKVERMKANIIQTLEHFPRTNVIGVIQGITTSIMDEIYEFEKEQGISIFARGGLIPIKRKNNLYCDTIKYSREIAKESYLHAFGIVNLDQIKCYGRCASIDSFDSTIARALTAELYFVDEKLTKHRFSEDVLTKCECYFCNRLRSLRLENYEYPGRSVMEKLYLHNIISINTYCENVQCF